MANKFNTGPKATEGTHNQRSQRIDSWFLETEDFDQQTSRPEADRTSTKSRFRTQLIKELCRLFKSKPKS